VIAPTSHKQTGNSNIGQSLISRRQLKPRPTLRSSRP
jgi:hypothetical protein